MIKNESSIHIYGWMLNELNLSGNDLLVYATIFSFTNGTEDHCYHGSAGYLAEWCGLSRRGVIKVLKKLCDLNLIMKEERIENNVKFVNYFTGCEQSSQGDENIVHEGGCEQSSHHNNRAIDNNRIDNKYVQNAKFDEFRSKYPKKKKKKDAERIFNKHKDQDLIISGLDKYLSYWKKKGTELQYIPDPTSWLNQERRNDELEENIVKGKYKPIKLNEHLSFNDLI